MAETRPIEAKEDIAHVARLLHAMLLADPTVSFHDIRRRNEQQGWTFTTSDDAPPSSDSTTQTQVAYRRLSPEDLEKAWAKAKRLAELNEFSWM